MDKQLSKKPLVSIIIPTYNRGQCLVDTLESLLLQDYPRFEIIVVDQSTKEFPEKNKYLKDHQNEILYFHLDKPSTPAAKNFGVQKSRGEIILFVDDDVLASKRLISAHIENYTDPWIGGVSGRVVTPGQALELKHSHVGTISPWGTVSGGFSSLIRQPVYNVLGCNCSWRKRAFEQVEGGGFDTNFIGNALREETDLALRIQKLKWKIIFDPLAELTHVRAVSGGCRKDNRLGWYHDFFHNETYFFLKHKSRIWFPLFWLIRWQYFVRCMFGFGREVSLRSLQTPRQGIADGFATYHRWQNENRS